MIQLVCTKFKLRSTNIWIQNIYVASCEICMEQQQHWREKPTATFGTIPTAIIVTQIESLMSEK